MEVADILPIVIPGLLIQVFVQIFYIRHCWMNSRLTQLQKGLYIAAMALFNMPAAAVYLFMTRPREQFILDASDDEIDAGTRQGIFVLLFIAFELMSLRLIINNLGQPQLTWATLLLGGCFVLLIINGLVTGRRRSGLFLLLPAVQIILVMIVEWLDRTQSADYIVLAVLASIINGYPLRLSKFYAAGALAMYAAAILGRELAGAGGFDPNKIISTIYINILIFLLVFLAFYTLKKQLLANVRLQQAMRQMQEQSRQLEAMAAIEERTRIAGEIHDTVGHTLTTAIIALEVGENLIVSDPEAARQKITLAGRQVRQGLDDIRSSVRMIEAGQDVPFAEKLEALLAEIRRTTDLKVTSIVELEHELLPIQQNVLLRAVRECATNSLKHGRSTELDVLVQEFRGSVSLTVSDDGCGAQPVEFGFGLKTMQGNIEGIGGLLAVSSVPGEGFTVSITIPAGAAQS